MSDDFTCADCGETFPKGRSDEEAAAEWERDFPGLPADADDMVVVCDDCYNAMRAKAAAVNFPWGAASTAVGRDVR